MDRKMSFNTTYLYDVEKLFNADPLYHRFNNQYDGKFFVSISEYFMIEDFVTDWFVEYIYILLLSMKIPLVRVYE